MTLNRITSILMVMVLALMVVGLGIWVLGMLAGEASAEGMEPIVLTASGSEGAGGMDQDGVAGWKAMEGTPATEMATGGGQELVSPVHLRDMASPEHDGSLSDPNHTQMTQGSTGSTATAPAPSATTPSTIHHATDATTATSQPMAEPEPHSGPSPTAGGTSMSPQQQTQPVEPAPHDGQSDGGMHGGG